MNDQPERPESAGVVSRLGGLNVNAGVLTVSAAAAYAVVRIMYAIYYGFLGASPEQVGLGYLETLSQGFVFIVVLVVGLLAAWLVLGIPVQAALGGAGRRPRVAAALLGLAVAAFFAGPLSTIGQRYTVAGSLAIWGVAWGVGIVLGAAAWALTRADGARSGGSLRARAVDARSWPPLYAVGLAVVTVSLFSSLLAGLAVRDGFVVPPILGNVTGLRAEPVVLLPVDARLPDGLDGGSLLYLGEHAGTGVFYDRRRPQGTYRIDLGRVTVVVLPVRGRR